MDGTAAAIFIPPDFSYEFFFAENAASNRKARIDAVTILLSV
jgi:hypothetical protein